MFSFIGTPPPTQALNLNNGVLTASAPVLRLGQTWNNAGANFEALVVDVVDTASGASSMLAEFKVGGVSKARISKLGDITGSNVRGVSVRADNWLWAIADTGGYYFGVNQDVALLRHSADVLKITDGSTGFRDLKLRYVYDQGGNLVLGDQQPAIADVASADATDLSSVVALANENKAKLNALLAAVRAFGPLAT